MSGLYTADQLPGFVPGTEGLLAQPRRTVFACVRAPLTATINLVAAQSRTPIHTHHHESGRHARLHGDTPLHVHLREGDLHLLVDLDGEHMAAPDALLEGEGATYSITHQVLANGDPRAAYLRGLWAAAYGIRPLVIEIRRIRPLYVVGQIPEASAATGRRFRSNDGQYHTLEPHAYVVRNHDDSLAVVTLDVMERLFASLNTADGSPRAVLMNRM